MTFPWAFVWVGRIYVSVYVYVCSGPYIYIYIYMREREREREREKVREILMACPSVKELYV